MQDDIGETKRVCFLISGLYRGGAETQLVKLATALSTRGWKVCLISLLPIPSGYFREILRSHGVLAKCLHGRRGGADPRLGWRLLKLLHRLRPHVLCGFMFHANLLARIVGRLAGVPVIVASIRGELFGWSGGASKLKRARIRERLIKWTDSLGDETVAVSRAQRRDLLRSGIVPSGRVSVIHHGVDLDALTQPPGVRRMYRDKLNLSEKTFLWLAVGRLEPVKDYATLLRACQDHLTSFPNTHLAIAGEGPLRGEHERWVCENGLAEQVSFLGLRDDVPAWIAASDAMVLASLHEGLPNVLLEAYAGAKPVVTTRSGSQAEIVRQGENGFLVPPQQPGRLAEAMSRLQGLPARERIAMGLTGRRRMEQEFNLESFYVSWEELFERLVRRKVRRVRYRPLRIKKAYRG